MPRMLQAVTTTSQPGIQTIFFFKDLEDRASTLSLCLTNIHAYALYDMQSAPLLHTMDTLLHDHCYRQGVAPRSSPVLGCCDVLKRNF